MGENHMHQVLGLGRLDFCRGAHEERACTKQQ